VYKDTILHILRHHLCICKHTYEKLTKLKANNSLKYVCMYLSELNSIQLVFEIKKNSIHFSISDFYGGTDALLKKST